MKTRTLKQSKSLDVKINKAVSELNKAEIAAWSLFIGVGITYIIMSLIVAI